MLLQRQPRLGLPRLRRIIPGLPRNALASYLRRIKALLGRCRRRNWLRLKWHLPGAVWAIDGTWLDRPVGTNGRRALVVVELHSHKTLCLRSVTGERTNAVIDCLRSLIEKHGAPLVLKADNGSAFVAAGFARFCAQHGITLLHSPVRRPRWNGTCEVSGRWAKRRAAIAARARGSPDRLSQDDLDCAITYPGTLPHIAEPLRQHFRAVVAREIAAAAQQWGLAFRLGLRDPVPRSLTRVAVRRALQLCHILTIEGRAYRQWLPIPAA